MDTSGEGLESAGLETEDAKCGEWGKVRSLHKVEYTDNRALEGIQPNGND